MLTAWIGVREVLGTDLTLEMNDTGLVIETIAAARSFVASFGFLFVGDHDAGRSASPSGELMTKDRGNATC